MAYRQNIEAVHRQWRVFYTFPRSEKKVEERLEEQQLEVFLPKCVSLHRWKDRQKKIIEPLFRNYIFAYVNERERLQVLQTQGIVRCVFFGGRMAELREKEIEQLKITQKEPDRLGLLGQWIPAVGKAVTIVQGPLSGLKGEVIEHRGQIHVIVRIDSIKQTVKINVPAAWVSSVGESRLSTKAHA